MKPSDFQRTIQCQFDCKLKRVVKGIVRNYRKELKRRRNKEISYPRQIAMYLLYSMCNLTYKKIAELTGRKDHTTVLYAVEKLSDRIKTDTSFKNTIEDIKHKIKE